MRTCPDCQATYDDDVLHCPQDGVALAPGEASDDFIGRTVGSYRVSRLLGKGGMGSVYLGEHPVIGSRVAIKFLHPQYSHDEKIVDRFFNEARAVNLIGHDNILKIIDLNVSEDNRHYFVMEFLHGRPLQSLLRSGAAVALEIAGPILLQVCDALGAAHSRGIVHRDLKPDNIYLINLKGKKNFVKVVDFGIAKLTDREGISTGQTQTGMVMGTPAYMSPEQAAGKSQMIDGRSDIYSLGVMMFQLATGKLPFAGSSFGDVLIGHMQTQPPRPRDLLSSVPEAYERIILKCLQKRPEDRYQKMSELHDAVLLTMQQLGITAELPPEDKTEQLDLPDLRTIPSQPGPRTPSQPGRSTNPRAARGPQAARTAPRPTGPPRTAPRRPTAAPQPHTTATPAPASHTRWVAGIVASAVVVLGVGGLFLYREIAKLVPAAPAAAAPPRPVEPPLAPALPRTAAVTIAAPDGAHVKATWERGEKEGPSPLKLEVALDSAIRYEVSKDGFLPKSGQLVADAPQSKVDVELTAVAAASIAAARPPEPEPKPPPRKEARSQRRAKAKVDPGGVVDVFNELSR